MKDTTSPVSMLNLINATAETTVIAAMRADSGAAVELAQLLEPTDFYDPRRSMVFEAVRAVLLGVEPLNDAAILAELRRVQRDRKSDLYIDGTYLGTFDGGDLARAVSYAHAVKRLSWLRGAGDFAYWLVEELQTRPDPDDLFTAAQERWQALRPKTVVSRFVYGWDTTKLHDDMIRTRIQEQQAGRLVRFDWPWQSWNSVIRPLRPGMVGIIAAPDGQGKTTYLEMIAEHWARQGQQVVYVHLEDELGYKLDRRLARHALISLDHIEDGRLAGEEQERIRGATQRISEWAGCLHYYDAAGDSMAAIVRELEARVAEGVCQAIVFDYLDKVQASRGQSHLYAGNTWERQANDMEQLKTFAERNKIPVLTATQGNKQMQETGTQTRRTIQGTGQKSHKAQLVVILTRELVGEDGLRDKNGRVIAEPGEYSPVVNVRIDKQNRGKTGGLRQFILGQFFTVRDIERTNGHGNQAD